MQNLVFAWIPEPLAEVQRSDFDRKIHSKKRRIFLFRKNQVSKIKTSIILFQKWFLNILRMFVQIFYAWNATKQLQIATTYRTAFIEAGG